MLARSDRVKKIFDESFNSANETYKKAETILETLNNFEIQLENNKQKAKQAESLKDEIEKNLLESRQLHDLLHKQLEQIKSYEENIN